MNETKNKAKEIYEYFIRVIKSDDKILNGRYKKEIIKEIEFLIDTD